MNAESRERGKSIIPYLIIPEAGEDQKVIRNDFAREKDDERHQFRAVVDTTRRSRTLVVYSDVYKVY